VLRSFIVSEVALFWTGHGYVLFGRVMVRLYSACLCCYYVSELGWALSDSDRAAGPGMLNARDEGCVSSVLGWMFAMVICTCVVVVWWGLRGAGCSRQAGRLSISSKHDAMIACSSLVGPGSRTTTTCSTPPRPKEGRSMMGRAPAGRETGEDEIEGEVEPSRRCCKCKQGRNGQCECPACGRRGWTTEGWGNESMEGKEGAKRGRG
jgi:hypothetical protein